jgi:hypothetical protein
MQTKLKHYVAISERRLADIAAEIGQSRQVVENWLKRDSPIFVTFDQDSVDTIQKVISEKVIYVCNTESQACSAGKGRQGH